MRARRSGERIVAALRLGLVVAFVAVTSFHLGTGMALAIQLGVSVIALAYAGLLYWWASTSTNPWLPWVSCALDVTLTSAGISVFLVAGDPLGTVNNRVLFEAYFFAIANSALRYDWRLCAFTVMLAVAQFLGLTGFAATHWDLAALRGPEERFLPVAYTLRLVLLVAAGASAIAVARWARHLRLLVGTDELTGLSQRRPFLERVDEQLMASSPARGVMSIAVLDVDEFKKFNDAYGHLAGDRALQMLAERLRSAVRTTDLVARFGGEEFVIAFPGMDVAQAVGRVEDLRIKLGQVGVPVDGSMRWLTMSAGVGSWPADGGSFIEVLAQADARLYEAKRRGRNCVVGPAPGGLEIIEGGVKG
ncbi:MAG TPA: GGDEF domain-containing protein [Myxococcaceae bacterium]|nr:GGDEF domain-containing protein [Myxococcaceae bacterium]